MGSLPLSANQITLSSSLGIDGWLAGKLRRNLDHRLIDHNGDGIQVCRIALEAKTLCLKGKGATAGKRIVKSG